MSVKLAKTSNYTGLDNLYFTLDDYLRDIDTDLSNLFFMANPTYQFGTGGSYSIIVYSGGNYGWTTVLGQWNITYDLLYAGAGATYIGLQPGVGIWCGDPTFANAPFSVDQNGVIKAHSGDIGGWNINATYIKDNSTDNNANILLDSVLGLIRVGPDTGNNYITIDGKNLYMQSSDYVSGPLGQGWHIDTNLAEFQNIRARGMFHTSTFEYDVISALGGNLLVANADILDNDMTSNDNSALQITTGTCFSVGDILRIKDGVNDEWLKVTSSSTAYTYVVTRDMDAQYGVDDNPDWKKGTCVVSYGSAGNGVIFMTGNGPYIDVITHTGSPYDYAPTQIRIGNLNGFLGYTTKAYGIAIGNATQYLKYDTANGFRVAGHTLLGELDISTNGYIASGMTDYNSGTGYWFDYNSGTPRFSIGCSTAANFTWDGDSIHIQTAEDGARLEIFPDANTGLAIYDSGGESVLQALIGGTNIGDVIIGPQPDSYTSLLCHFNGADGSTTFTEETGKTVSATAGNAQIDTDSPKFGTGACLFDGTDDWLTTPHSTDFVFGTSNFTIDCWVRFSNVNTASGICGQQLDANNYWNWYRAASGDNRRMYFQVISAGNNVCYVASDVWNDVVTDTYYHITATRIGSNMKFFVNGTEKVLDPGYGNDTFGNQAFGAYNNLLNIGGTGLTGAQYPFLGHIDEFRISKGIARWTSDFTVPSAEYDYSPGTSYIKWDSSEDEFLVSNLQSLDYVASTTGYKLSASDGLEINTGSIEGVPLLSKILVYAMIMGDDGT